jgi:hypothetical protein
MGKRLYKPTGKKIWSVEHESEGDRVELLSTMFTAEVEGKVRFFFYVDHNCTWRNQK